MGPLNVGSTALLFEILRSLCDTNPGIKLYQQEVLKKKQRVTKKTASRFAYAAAQTKATLRETSRRVEQVLIYRAGHLTASLR